MRVYIKKFLAAKSVVHVVMFAMGSCQDQCPESDSFWWKSENFYSPVVSTQTLILLNKEFFEMVFRSFSLIHFYFFGITMLPSRHFKRGRRDSQSLAIFLASFRGCGVCYCSFVWETKSLDEPFGSARPRGCGALVRSRWARDRVLFHPPPHSSITIWI